MKIIVGGGGERKFYFFNSQNYSSYPTTMVGKKTLGTDTYIKSAWCTVSYMFPNATDLLENF